MRETQREFVSKGWGYEDIITNSPAYCGKVLHVGMGRKCSWHYHKKKDETFYMASGRLRLRYLPQEDVDIYLSHGWDEVEVLRRVHMTYSIVLEKGDSFHVPVGMRHQFEGLTDDVVLIEFSTQHFDDDSIRVIPGD